MSQTLIETKFKEWLRYSGVIISGTDLIEEHHTGRPVLASYLINLVHLKLSLFLVKMSDGYHYSIHDSVASGAIIRYLQAGEWSGRFGDDDLIRAKCLQLVKLKLEDFDNELNPIPLERRTEREDVMAKYPMPLNLGDFSKYRLNLF